MNLKCLFGHNWCAYPHSFVGTPQGARNTQRRCEMTVEIETNICLTCNKRSVEVKDMIEHDERWRSPDILMRKTVVGHQH